MDPYDVGLFRRCPACGRPIVDGPFSYGTVVTGGEMPNIPDVFDVRCSCCDRPWDACPCTPVEEGPCRSVRPE